MTTVKSSFSSVSTSLSVSFCQISTSSFGGTRSDNRSVFLTAKPRDLSRRRPCCSLYFHASLLFDQLDEPQGGKPLGAADYLLQLGARHERGAARPRIVGEAVQPVAVVRGKPRVDGSATDAETVRNGNRHRCSCSIPCLPPQCARTRSCFWRVFSASFISVVAMCRLEILPYYDLTDLSDYF